MPDPAQIEEIREPYIKVTVILPAEYIGAIMKLCEDRRGTLLGTEYLSEAG